MPPLDNTTANSTPMFGDLKEILPILQRQEKELKSKIPSTFIADIPTPSKDFSDFLITGKKYLKTRASKALSFLQDTEVALANKTPEPLLKYGKRFGENLEQNFSTKMSPEKMKEQTLNFTPMGMAKVVKPILGAVAKEAPSILRKLGDYVYHTTSVSNASKIRRGGLQPASGKYGRGVYFAPTQEFTGGYGSLEGAMIRVKRSNLPKNFQEFPEQGWSEDSIPSSLVEVSTDGGKSWKPGQGFAHPSTGKAKIGTILGGAGVATAASIFGKKEDSKSPEMFPSKSNFDEQDFTKRLVNVENGVATSTGENLYDVIGVTGDIGKYQASPRTIKDWSKTWLNKQYTPEQFRKDPQAQEAFYKEFLAVVKKHELTPEQAAIAWHSGWGELGTGVGTKEKRHQIFTDSINKRMQSPENQRYLSIFNR